MMPGSAPSTPASNEPSREVTFAVLELGGVLAEVPDVAVAVLRVPVEGVLDDLSVLGHRVADDAGGRRRWDLPGLARRRHDVLDGALPSVSR